MNRLLHVYHCLEDAVMVLLLGTLLVMSFSQVGGRLILNMGIQSGDAIIYHLVLWTGLWGALLATRQKEHITIDVVSRFVHGRYRHLVRLLTNLFSCAICSILVYAAVRFVHDEMTLNDARILNVPLWVFQVIMPFTLAVMTIRFFAYGICDLYFFINPIPTPENPAILCKSDDTTDSTPGADP